MINWNRWILGVDHIASELIVSTISFDGLEITLVPILRLPL